MRKWIFSLLLLVLLLPLCAAARADDGDDTGGSVMDAGLQWRLADATWNKRQYDDAASIMEAFATANPDDPNALEALWRTYQVYRSYRPNPDRKKVLVGKLGEACARWIRKYNVDNKERAGQGMWYSAMLNDQEGQRPQALSILADLVRKYPGTSHELDADWTSGEWYYQAHQWKQAIDSYTAYRTIVKNTQEYGAACSYRIGWASEELGDKQGAIDAYKYVLDNNFNWGWGQVAFNAMDCARRLKAMGEGELARKFSLMVIDKCPKEWTDLQNQAHIMLGDKDTKQITIYPHRMDTYTGHTINLTGGGKLSLVRDAKLLVRLGFVTKDTPFRGTLTILPKVDMAVVPDGMKKVENGDGKVVYTADIVAPDKNGGVTGDWWYQFTQANQEVDAPGGLTVTRKWEKQGNGWGESTIRVQSTGRWHFWIYLPSASTNVNNLSIQPNEVNDGGKTFRWYDWYDLNAGMTIKFPVEVGANVDEYYPKMRFERNVTRLGDKSGNETDASMSLDEFDVKLSSDKQFPYTFTFPDNEVIYLDEISK